MNINCVVESPAVEVSLFSGKGGVDHDVELSEAQARTLQECLSITKTKVYEYAEIN
jgi:hypothetical protein